MAKSDETSRDITSLGMTLAQFTNRVTEQGRVGGSHHRDQEQDPITEAEMKNFGRRMMKLQATGLARALHSADDKRFRDEPPLNEERKKRRRRRRKILERAKKGGISPRWLGEFRRPGVKETRRIQVRAAKDDPRRAMGAGIRAAPSRSRPIRQ